MAALHCSLFIFWGRRGEGLILVKLNLEFADLLRKNSGDIRLRPAGVKGGHIKKM